MTDPLFYRDSLQRLLELSESPTMKLVRELSESRSMQAAQAFSQSDLLRAAASVSQVASSFDTLTQSPHWAEVSAQVSTLSHIIQQPEMLSALNAIQSDMRRLSDVVDQVVLPAASALQSYINTTAAALPTLQAHFSDLARWRDSLNDRITSLSVPWAIEDHLGLSVTAFARVARLSDLARSPERYAGPTVEIFDEELGDPALYEEGTEDRDGEAIDAGLNPELITFPKQAYPDVLISAGFELRVSVIEPVRSEGGDGSGAFHPGFMTMLDQVQHQMRVLVETELKKIAGEHWLRQRVPSDMRKRWVERKDKDQAARGDSYGLIFYCDFPDLVQIICRGDNWNDAFSRFFPSKEDLQVSFARLNPVRNALAHGRPLVRADQLILVSEGTRILSALGIKL